MKKHYVRYYNEWRQIHPVIITTVDCVKPTPDGLIKFYHSDLGVLPGPGAVINEALICTIYDNDPNYKVEEIEYGLFNKKGRLIGRMEHYPGVMPGNTYVMEMKRL